MKIFEYFEDAYYWSIRTFKDIRLWCRYNTTKEHWNVVKKAWLGYPFDYSYIYELEKAKLKELYAYFSTANYISKEQYDEYCSKIRLAINLLDIIIEDDSITSVYVNTRNWERYMPWYRSENIQTKYIKETADEWRHRILTQFSGALRTEKARHLYFKLRLQYGETWWD